MMYLSAQSEGLGCFVSRVEVEGLEYVFDVPVEIAIDAIERVVFKLGSDY